VRVLLRLDDAVEQRNLRAALSTGAVCRRLGARTWLSAFSGVAYSAARYTNSSFVFQLNTDVKSASIENAKYACAVVAH
jgi:hypothetical protein